MGHVTAWVGDKVDIVTTTKVKAPLGMVSVHCPWVIQKFESLAISNMDRCRMKVMLEVVKKIKNHLFNPLPPLPPYIVYSTRCRLYLV